MLMSETVNKSKTFCPLENCALLRCDSTAGPFPTILKLLDAMCAMPVQTVAVEGGFSMHRIVKKRLTRRLKITTPLNIVQLLTTGDYWVSLM